MDNEQARLDESLGHGLSVDLAFLLMCLLAILGPRPLFSHLAQQLAEPEQRVVAAGPVLLAAQRLPFVAALDLDA